MILQGKKEYYNKNIKKEKPKMAYSVKSKKSGKTYYLHSKDVVLRNGRKQKIFYFSGSIGKEALNAVPAGYEVIESPLTGLPLLRRKK